MLVQKHYSACTALFQQQNLTMTTYLIYDKGLGPTPALGGVRPAGHLPQLPQIPLPSANTYIQQQHCVLTSLLCGIEL